MTFTSTQNIEYNRIILSHLLKEFKQKKQFREIAYSKNNTRNKAPQYKLTDEMIYIDIYCCYNSERLERWISS